MERAQLIALVRGAAPVFERNGFVFVRDPHWSAAEAAAAATLIDGPMPADGSDSGWLCLRTGGTSGGFKFARHDERTVGAAVRGFCEHFQLSQVNAVGVLPPWHVSGLMARVRCAATGGTYLDCEWKALEGGQFPALPLGTWVLSLVPTQLQRLLDNPAAIDWLKRFAVIFLGGGPTWPSLAAAAAASGLRIALSYGMTETAAMVTAQTPEEFLAGDRSAGAAMPHARVAIDPEGRVTVAGESLFRGYYPQLHDAGPFVTQDLGRFDTCGRLHLLGRSDAVIISGGKKIDPAEVEAALRASGEFEDVVIVSVADAEWGEIVVACHPAGSRLPDTVRAVRDLAPHQRPKRFLALSSWPRSAQGKINRAALKELAARASST